MSEIHGGSGDGGSLAKPRVLSATSSGKTLLDRDAETKCGAGAQPWSVRYMCEDLKWSKRHMLDIPRGRRCTNIVLKTGLGKGTRS